MSAGSIVIARINGGLITRMVHKERCIVVDIDGTLCPTKGEQERYEDLPLRRDVVDKLHEYRALGFYLILHTSRNMRTYEGNLGLINANTAKSVLAWLDRNGIPYDEIYFGKPWPGKGGFYVDDKAVRPDEFAKLTYDEILVLVGDE